VSQVVSPDGIIDLRRFNARVLAQIIDIAAAFVGGTGIEPATRAV
jgi:hypothetical protein